MGAQEVVLDNHAHIGVFAAHLAETAGKDAMPEERHFLQQRALRPGHAQQPPALLIGWRIEVEVQLFQAVLHSVVGHLLVVEEAINRASIAQSPVQSQIVSSGAKSGTPQQVSYLHLVRYGARTSARSTMRNPLLQRNAARRRRNANATKRGKARQRFPHEAAARRLLRGIRTDRNGCGGSWLCLWWRLHRDSRLTCAWTIEYISRLSWFIREWRIHI